MNSSENKPKNVLQYCSYVVFNTTFSTHSKNTDSFSHVLCLMCPGLEKKLQNRLRSLTTAQLMGTQDMQEIAETTDNLNGQKQTYETKAEDIQNLTEDMKLQLEQARANLRAVVRDCSLDKVSGVRMWISFRPSDVLCP